MAYIEFIQCPNNEGTRQITHVCTFGRAEDNDLYLHDLSVSRYHGRIVFTGHYFEIEDIGSKNGLKVNNYVLAPHATKVLYDQDTIQVGDTIMVFHAEGKHPYGKRNFKPPETEDAPVNQIDTMGGVSVLIKDQPFALENQPVETILASTTLFELEKIGAEDDSTLKRLKAMVEVSNSLSMVVSSDVLMRKILDNIFDIFPQADRSFIMLWDESTKQLNPQAGRRRGTTETTVDTFAVSQTIIAEVMHSKHSVLSSDATKDERFKPADSVSDYSIRSLMYVPFIYNNEFLGIISVDTISRKYAFTFQDLSILTGIAAQVAIALKSVQLYQTVLQETQLRTQLSRYLSSDMVDSVISGVIPWDLDGQKKYGTILFGDIIGFTAVSESMTAIEVIGKLNRYFSSITEVVARNHGTVHKFEGDMLMAFWNVLLHDDEADFHAVYAALEMQIAVWKLGAEIEAESGQPFQIGIGISTGECAGGNIGGKEKMEYTVIGDTINLGKRIESLASRYQVFVSETTYQAVAKRCCAIALPTISVKGKSTDVRTYSIRGLALHESSFLLAIPITLQDPKAGFTKRGILTGITLLDGQKNLSIYSPYIVPMGTRITLRFFLYELPVEGYITGTVSSVALKNIQDTEAYGHYLITGVSCDPALEALLQPGFLTESTQTWQDMRRQ